MDHPIKAFEITGRDGELIKLNITEVYDFPHRTSFRGGYDILCDLQITAGGFSCYSNHYSSTGALYDFYTALTKCYDALSGKAAYKVYHAEDDLEFDVIFEQSRVKVVGDYRNFPISKNSLHFEFLSDQSYFTEVLLDLKKIVATFGDNKGVKK